MQELYTALNHLVRETPIERVSVRDLTSLAGVSRSTFYRHYYDKYALLNSYYNTNVKAILKEESRRELSWLEALTAILKVLGQNREFYQNAIKGNNSCDLKAHITKISRHFYMTILSQNGVDLNYWKNSKALDFYICGTLEILYSWMREGMVEKPGEMADLILSLLPSRFPFSFEGWKTALISGMYK